MSANCKYEAPNGKKSELYDTVYSLYGADPAQKVWSYVKTSDFKTFFGDWETPSSGSSTAVDANGEPAIIKGNFHNTRTGEILPLTTITDNLSKLAQERINVINRLAGIQNRYQNSGKQASVGKIENLKNQLTQVEEDKIALFRFIQFASTQAKAAYDELLVLEKKLKDPSRTNDQRRYDLKDLSRLTEYLSSFELIEGVGNAVSGLSYDDAAFGGVGVADDTFQNTWIAPILKQVAYARLKYNELAKPLVADFLLRYNNDRNLTKQDLITQLTTIHEDVSLFQRWSNGLAESGDSVLALVNRAISDVRNELNQQAFRFKQTKMAPLLTQLEQEAKLKGVAADDYEKLYDFMLERDAKGKLTGKYVYPTNGTNTQKEFYKFYVSEYMQSMALLPDMHRRPGQLVPILKSATERAFNDVKGIVSGAKAVGKLVSQKFVKNVTDTDKGQVEKTLDEEGNEVQFIPIHYTSRIGEGNNVTPSDVSLNLAANLMLYRHMAHNFHGMSEIITELESTKDLVGARKLVRSQGDNVIINRVTKQAATEQGTNTYAYKQLQDYLTMHVYGERQADEGSFNFFGIEVDKAKLANNIAGGTAFVQLGLNVYSAINNYTVGNYTNYLESAGGQFYGPGHLSAAKADYVKAIPELLKDFSGRFPTSKLGVCMEELDIFQEESPTGELLREKSFMRRAGLGASMFLTKAGEHGIQSELFIAMSKSHRTYNGTIGSYSDWVVEHNKKFDKESKAAFEKLPDVWSQLTAKEGVIDTKLDRRELTKFAERVKGVYQRLHGNYANRDTPALNRWGVGRLVGLFRKFLKPGWDRRWAKDTFGKVMKDGELVDADRFDQRLGANIGGNYTITYNFLKKAIGDFNTMGSFMMREDWSKLPEWKKQAIKRTAMEALALMGVALMAKGLGSFIDDDDPNWLATMGTYQMNRLKQEILAFVNPITAMDLLRSPAASMSIFQKTGRVIAQLVPGAYGAIDSESGIGRFESGTNAGDLKLPHYVGAMVPLYSQVQRVFEPKEQLSWLLK